eukprot:scaffold177483_cov43-Attheya_sp.AAC.1
MRTTIKGIYRTYAIAVLGRQTHYSHRPYVCPSLKGGGTRLCAPLQGGTTRYRYRGTDDGYTGSDSTFEVLTNYVRTVKRIRTHTGTLNIED